jgi:hypothetical protein
VLTAIRDKLLEQSPDLIQQFIDKGYLAEGGVAGVLLRPELLSKFLSGHDLMQYFNDTEGLKRASFLDADKDYPEYPSAILEYREGSCLQSASVQVMVDSLLREEHLCPVRIMRTKNRYQLLLAPLSESNIAVLDKFYSMYRINIARAYRVRRDILNKPFSSQGLPACLATLFIKQNSMYEQGDNNFDGIMVSDECCNPDATIMSESPEMLAQRFKPEPNSE